MLTGVLAAAALRCGAFGLETDGISWPRLPGNVEVQMAD